MFVLFIMSALVHHVALPFILESFNYISVLVSPRLHQHLVLSIQQPLYLIIPPALNILTVHDCRKTYCYYYYYYYNIICVCNVHS